MTVKKVLLGILIAFLLMVGYVIQAGIAVVHIRTPDTRLWVPVPVALGHAIGYFIDIPASHQPEYERFLEYRHQIAKLLAQLQSVPDATFVEVDKPGEHARIYKQVNALCVDVDGLNEKVKVRVPLAMMDRLVEALTKTEFNLGDIFASLEWQPSGDLVHVQTNHEEVRISIW